MNGKDSATKAWRTVLAVFVVNREEMRDKHRDLLAEKRRKCEHDIDEYIRRVESSRQEQNIKGWKISEYKSWLFVKL